LKTLSIERAVTSDRTESGATEKSHTAAGEPCLEPLVELDNTIEILAGAVY
jgi:hypothetical protein